VAIVAMMALGGATSQLPIVQHARAPSTRAVQPQGAGVAPRRSPRRFPRLFLRRFLRQAAVGAAGLGQIAAIAAKMGLGGAISLLGIVLSAPAPSTLAVRPRPAVGAPAGRGPRQPQCPQLLRGHLWRNTEG